MKHRRYKGDRYRAAFFVSMIASVALMGFVIGIIIWGTWIMRDSLNAKTEKHISDVTEKLADYMEFRIETKLNYM